MDLIEGALEIMETLALVLDAVSTEKHHILARNAKLFAGVVLVDGAIDVGVDGIGNVEDAHILENVRLLSHIGKPLTATHKRNRLTLGDGEFALKPTARKIIVALAPAEEIAVAAAHEVTLATPRIMADARKIVHIVHREHNTLAHIEEFFELFEREHTLARPMEIDDVGILDERIVEQSHCPKIVDGDVVKVFFPEPQKPQNLSALHTEFQEVDAPAKPIGIDGMHPRLVRLSVANEHINLVVAVLAQRPENAQASDACPALLV